MASSSEILVPVCDEETDEDSDHENFANDCTDLTNDDVDERAYDDRSRYPRTRSPPTPTGNTCLDQWSSDFSSSEDNR